MKERIHDSLTLSLLQVTLKCIQWDIMKTRNIIETGHFAIDVFGVQPPTLRQRSILVISTVPMLTLFPALTMLSLTAFTFILHT